MIRRSLIVVGFFALACGDRAPRPDAAEQAAVEDSLETVSTPEPPPMPDRPSGESGRLTVRAVGAFELEHGWPARAGRCARPAMVLIIAEEPGSGASVLLHLPTAGELTGAYPIKLADSGGMPAPPASQVGFQFFQGTTADAYQGAEGEVEVRELSDRRISGRLAVTLRHVLNNAIAQVAGTFQQVDIEPLPPDWCERAAAAQDSLMVADSTSGGA